MNYTQIFKLSDVIHENDGFAVQMVLKSRAQEMCSINLCHNKLNDED